MVKQIIRDSFAYVVWNMNSHEADCPYKSIDVCDDLNSIFLAKITSTLLYLT